MTESEVIFNNIVNEVSNGIKGKMFGADCIKSAKGKTAAFLWKETMVFKLDKINHEKAMRIEGAKIGCHIYAPDKQMKGWVSIPKSYSNKWMEFTEKALQYVISLK